MKRGHTVVAIHAAAEVTSYMTGISAWDGKAAKGTSALAARVLELVASGQASSRAELAGLLGVSASTISLSVAQLVERGLIAEEGTQTSTGGRPRKALRLGSDDEFAVAADLGGFYTPGSVSCCPVAA